MERIVVVGAGIAGLAVALAQKHSERSVTLVERDPAPPELSPQQAFEEWARPGVPQFRHAHILLARLHTILRDDHPALLAALFEAGLELSSLKEILPAGQRALDTAPEDRDLLHLWGRRATFEYITRRYVERLPNVRFVHAARVVGLISESSADGVRVRGVELVHDGAREVCEADVVVDASGRRSQAADWLRALGVKVRTTARPAEREYMSRHYRLRDPSNAPSRVGGGAHFDFFAYATFYAEHGHFAITLSCPSEEREFARAIRDPECFDAVCRSQPTLARWLDAAQPTSKVFGASHAENRWVSYGARGGKVLSGFFAVGDSHVLTNPLYGRGCASAFVQAKALAEVMNTHDDARVRARRYNVVARELLQGHFGFCVASDRMFQSRAKLSRGQAMPLGDRLLKYWIEEAWTPAIQRSSLVAREAIRAMQMSQASPLRLRLGVMLRLMIAWIVSRFRPQDRARPEPSPPREAFLRSLPQGKGATAPAKPA